MSLLFYYWEATSSSPILVPTNNFSVPNNTPMLTLGNVEDNIAKNIEINIITSMK